MESTPSETETAIGCNPCANIEIPPDPVLVDMRGTYCAEFFSELRSQLLRAVHGGYPLAFEFSHGQKMLLALGPFGIDPVLGPYTITPDDMGYDFEVRCDATPEVVASYPLDISNGINALAYEYIPRHRNTV